MMVCGACRQTVQRQNIAYGNIITFHITANQAISYAVLAHVMVNHLCSADGFFQGKLHKQLDYSSLYHSAPN